MKNEEEATTVNDSGSYVSDQMENLLCFNFILSLLLGNRMTQIWSLLNGIQIVQMLPLF